MRSSNAGWRRGGRALAVALLSGVVAQAAEGPAAAQPPGPDRLRWSLGLAVISSPEPYVGADDELLVVPALNLSYKRFAFRGIFASYRLLERDGFTVEATLRPRFQGYEVDDSPALAGLRDRSKSADLGLTVGWEGERIGVQLTPLTDFLGRSGGQELGLELYLPLEFGRLRLQPRAGGVWQSADLVDYYYGVRPAEARPGRPAYAAGSTTAGLLAVYPWRRWILQGFVRFEQLGGEIEESPIVDRTRAVTAFAGASYSF